MPSARRKQPVVPNRPTPRPLPKAPSGGFRGLHLGKFSQLSGLLRVKHTAITASQYNEYTALLHEGYDEGTAIVTAAPDLNDEDVLFITTGIMPDEV